MATFRRHIPIGDHRIEWSRSTCLRMAHMYSHMVWAIIAAVAIAARVTACDLPVIATQPMPQTICVGDTLTLEVQLQSPTGAETFQWRRNDSPISGATGATLTIPNAATTNAGDYEVVVTNSCGPTTSTPAAVYVLGAPVFVENPQSQAVCSATNVTLTATVSDQGNALIDSIGGTTSSGNASVLRGNVYHATTSTTLTRIEHYLKLNAATTLVFFVYEATAAGGPFLKIAEDRVATVVQGETFYSSKPLRVSLVADRYYIIGAGWPIAAQYFYRTSGSPPPHPTTMSFGVSMNGYQSAYVDTLPQQAPINTSPFAHRQRLTTETSPLTFQWYRDDVEIDGETDYRMIIPNFSEADVAAYRVRATNACDLSALSTAAQLTLKHGPRFLATPGAVQACLGSPVTLRVRVEAASPTYEWRKNGAAITGATSAQYRIAAVTANDTASYSVKVTDASGCAPVISASIPLSVVSAAPAITNQSQDRDMCDGDDVTLSVSASGSNLLYQWRHDGVDIPGAKSSTLSLPDFTDEDVGVYEAQVENACGVTLSAPIALSISSPITIDESPADVALCLGETLTLTARFTGQAGLQWQHDGVDIPGATEATLVIANAVEDDSGAYKLIATNGCGQKTTVPTNVAVVDAPKIKHGPQSRVVNLGESTSISLDIDPMIAPSESHTIGLAENSSVGARLRGNAYLALDDAKLERVEHYLDITTAGPLVFFVYESIDGVSPFTKIAEAHVASAGPGARMYASPPLAVSLRAGRRYIIGAGWSGSHRQYWASAPHPQDAGTLQSYAGFAASYSNPLPSSPNADSPLVFYQRLTLTNATREIVWLKDGQLLNGENAVALTFDNVACEDAGLYRARVTDACGETLSQPALLTVQGCAPLTHGASGGGDDQGGVITP